MLEFEDYKLHMRESAQRYTTQITRLRKDNSKLLELYAKIERDVDPRAILPQKALDRIPKIDK